MSWLTVVQGEGENTTPRTACWPFGLLGFTCRVRATGIPAGRSARRAKVECSPRTRLGLTGRPSGDTIISRESLLSTLSPPRREISKLAALAQIPDSGFLSPAPSGVCSVGPAALTLLSWAVCRCRTPGLQIPASIAQLVGTFQQGYTLCGLNRVVLYGWGQTAEAEPAAVWL